MPDADARPHRDSALRWLSHPTTCVAVALLLVNDHVLKAAFGTWWTGKLSDVAGLLVAPPLVALGAAVVVRRPPRWSAHAPLVAVVLVGLLFTLVKGTVQGATLASAAWSVVDGPAVVLRDPTDLLALPALGLAWWVGARARAGAGRALRRRPPARWLVVVPVAVLAVAATTSTVRDQVTSVDVVDGMLVATMESGGHLESYFESADGEAWEQVDDGTALRSRLDLLDPAGLDACVPGDKRVCYTPVGRLQVGRSTNGGRSWTVDWAVPDEDLAELAARFDPPVGELATHRVAVLPTADGYRVYAANGGDGLAVRHEDGTWERLGYPFLRDVNLVPLPSEPTRMTYPLPPGMLVGSVAAVVVVLAAGRRPDRYLGAGRVVAGLLLLVASGALLVGILALDRGWAMVAGQEGWGGLGLGVVLEGASWGYLTAVPLAWLLAGAFGLIGGAAATLHRGAAFLPACAAGFTVWLATLLPGGPWVALPLAVAATLGGAALARVLVQRSGLPDEPLPWRALMSRR
ncbi:hypothetical protein Cch01nite_17200 [Cellulomonas chitinilytica]|uniref:Uncharacterized protein n=1 Tax=Cellulomonas chitinilytica TaxID=398759 RepID=A0A919P0A6_9CELL|nr:hypothetical protein [Cellulomonas chitinilytica]GIG20996.1 hypothetical protein Cch01nite_17200 [Cellulomonas chitinilytica]